MTLSVVPAKPLLRATQRGAVLFIALVFLILLSLLAVSASSTSIMQERMTGGLRNSHLGLMGAESALRYSESYLWKLPGRTQGGIRFACGKDGLIGENSEVGCFRRSYGEISEKVRKFRSKGGANALPDANKFGFDVTKLTEKEETANLASQPRYIIEEVARYREPGDAAGQRMGAQFGVTQGQGGANDPENLRLFRITARSDGGNDSVHRVTESTFLGMLPVSFNPGGAP